MQDLERLFFIRHELIERKLKMGLQKTIRKAKMRRRIGDKHKKRKRRNLLHRQRVNRIQMAMQMAMRKRHIMRYYPICRPWPHAKGA